MFDFGGFEPRPSASNNSRFRIEGITIVKAFCPRRSQYKCHSRRKQDTKSHYNNWDEIISGNLEHRETPKIAKRPVSFSKMAEDGFASSRKRIFFGQ